MRISPFNALVLALGSVVFLQVQCPLNTHTHTNLSVSLPHATSAEAAAVAQWPQGISHNC